MQKLSKLSPYAKSYLTGGAVLGGLGAAGGAFLQKKETLQGDKFDTMSPDEQRARIRRQRLIGAAGGAVRGLALNHMANNALIPSDRRSKDLAHIVGGATVLGLGGAYADHKRLDDAAMRKLYEKNPYETNAEYKARLSALRFFMHTGNIQAALVIGRGAMEVRDAVGMAGDLRSAYNRGATLDYGPFSLHNGRFRFSGSAQSPIDNVNSAAQEFSKFTDGAGIGKKDLAAAAKDKATARALRTKLKKAYRSAAKTHHPDKGGDPEKFKRMQTAYENLDSFLEKNSAWLGHRLFAEKLARARYQRREHVL